MRFRVLMLICVIVTLISCSRKDGRVLYIFNWTDYIDNTLVERFEQEYDCKIVYDTFDSNENMLTKVLTTKASYDLIVPSGDHVNIMIKKDLLEPIDKTKLTNYKNLNPIFLERSTSFDPDNKYAIPYFWGTTCLIYNKKHVPPDIINKGSWDIIADPFFEGKGKITLLDDQREVVGAALMKAGFDPNNTSEGALKAADLVLQKWDKNVSQYDSDSYKNEVLDGTTWLAQGYSGDALQAMQNSIDVDFVNPIEGTSLWIDSIVIPKGAEHKDLAYKFIDFLLDANNGKINAEFVFYATPNAAAYNLLSEETRNDPHIYPGQDYLQKCKMIQNIGDNVLKIDKIWQKIRK